MLVNSASDRSGDALVAEFAASYLAEPRTNESPDTAAVSGDSLLRLRRHLELGEVRERGETAVGTTELDDGAVEIHVVADDMPLLVEAVLGTLDAAGLTIAVNDHPILSVRRDGDGRIVGIDGPALRRTGAGAAESWISVTTGPAPGCDIDRLRSEIGAALVRAQAVDLDSDRIQARLAVLAERFSDDDEDADIVSWFAIRDNFLAVGYREARAGEGGLGVWRDATTA
ncbi:MAG: NAD-glutamate dehydrogenase, partial [Gordonia sp.]|nr:NAD-glutamate dehydrogenase [Gordonia sp. (in: high G+C Gram-positive bacteria)]